MITTVLLLATICSKSHAVGDNRRYDRQTLLDINHALISSSQLPTTLPAIDPDLIPSLTTTTANGSNNHNFELRGDYWSVDGIETYNAGIHSGPFKIRHSTLENLYYRGGESGFFLKSHAGIGLMVEDVKIRDVDVAGLKAGGGVYPGFKIEATDHAAVTDEIFYRSGRKCHYSLLECSMKNEGQNSYGATV